MIDENFNLIWFFACLFVPLRRYDEKKEEE